jgi:Tfp pilus assembly protein PilF
MSKRLFLLLPILATVLAAARDKAENWTEVRSPHFTVVTNSNEKEGRRVADQFERMRSAFQAAFPNLQIDTGSPIVVLAIKDDKTFKTLEPEAYLAKGSLKVGGLFMRAPDENYVLMRLDAEGDHPYAVVYHEYTHLLLSKAAEWIPLWLNEGLAEFYQNTEINEKDVSLGKPSLENIQLLRQNKMLPLPTLFTVDASSPYYHEENKGSIFYAESWALVHYLMETDRQQKTHRLTDYWDLMANRTEPVSAATQAFGDLNRLQATVDAYVHQENYLYVKVPISAEVAPSTFTVSALAAAQADAVRADFLAYNGRTADAQALLDRILQEDPKNVSAQETMGFIAFRQGRVDEARKRYAEAVQLDSQSFLAHYYFAAISMNGPLAAADEAQVESSLRSAIKLNPSFAPTYDRLAVFLGMRSRHLEEARLMGVKAVSLEPANIGYRMNVANVLMAAGKPQSAVEVLRAAAKLAKTPQETQAVDNMLMNAQEYAAAQARSGDQSGHLTNGALREQAASAPDVPQWSHRKEFVPSGPHRFVVGVLKGVHCDAPNLDLTVTAGAKTLALHTDNYYKLPFTALNFQPTGDLKPCHDLENRPAKVEYVESADKADPPHLIAIELYK